MPVISNPDIMAPPCLCCSGSPPLRMKTAAAPRNLRTPSTRLPRTESPSPKTETETGRNRRTTHRWRESPSGLSAAVRSAAPCASPLTHTRIWLIRGFRVTPTQVTCRCTLQSLDCGAARALRLRIPSIVVQRCVQCGGVFVKVKNEKPQQKLHTKIKCTPILPMWPTLLFLCQLVAFFFWFKAMPETINSTCLHEPNADDGQSTPL